MPRVDEVLGAREAGEAAAHDDHLLLLAHALEVAELLGQRLAVAVVVRVLNLRGLGEVLGDDAKGAAPRGGRGHRWDGETRADLLAHRRAAGERRHRGRGETDDHIGCWRRVYCGRSLREGASTSGGRHVVDGHYLRIGKSTDL